jgi:hypothetical protein
MPQIVEVPGMGDVEFPDGMSDDEIASAIKANMQPQNPADQVPNADALRASAVKQQPEGFLERLGRQFRQDPIVGMVGSGLGTIAKGAPEAIPTMLHNTGVTMGAGIGAPIGEEGYVENFTNRYAYQPRGESAQKLLAGVGDAFSPMTNVKQALGGKALEVTGSPLVATAFDMAPDLALTFAGGGSVPKGVKPKTAPYKPAVPTTDQLADASNAMYRASEEAGVVIKPQSTQKAVDIIDTVVKAENLGKMPPKIKEAHDTLTARIAKNEPLTLKEADKVRQIISDAFKSTDAADQRIAGIIKDQYDTYLDGLTARDVAAGNTAQGVEMLQQARALYRRRKNSEMADTMEANAALDGEAKYTQAGLEHALRGEYKKLAKDERRMKMLTAEQQEAVREVVRGGAVTNTLRNVGKLDPMRGGMAQALGLGVGGGLGAMAGAAFGDAGMAGTGAMIGSGAMSATANVANKIATKRTVGRVDKAREALVGRGLPSIPRGGLLSKEQPAATASAVGILGGPAPRTAAVVQADIAQLAKQAELALAKQPPGSPQVQRFVARLKELQSELAAVEAAASRP